MNEIKLKLKEHYPYILELLNRVYVLTLVFCFFFIAGLFLSVPAIKFFTRVFNFKGVDLAVTMPFQLLDLVVSVALFFSLIFTLPFFIYHFYAFIGSGLKQKEKKFFFLVLPLAIFLFLFGFAYGFFSLYLTMQGIADINTSLGVKNLWDVNMFLSQIVTTSAVLGLIFEFPILISALVRFKVVRVDFLKEKRRHAIFGIVCFTSLLPPTDGISLLTMVLPLIIMYEVTVMYNRFSFKYSNLSE